MPTKARSGFPMSFPEAVAPAAPAAAEAAAVTGPMAEFNEALKWGEFAKMPAQERNIKQVFNALLDELRDRGADDRTIQRLRRRGAANVLRGKALPADLARSLGKGANHSLRAAQAALRGFKGKDLERAVSRTLGMLKRTGEFDDALLKEIGRGLKKAGPGALQKIPVQQVVAGLAERGQGGILEKLAGKITGRKRGVVGPAVAEAATAVGPATPATRQALTKAGIGGMGKTLGRRLLGPAAAAAFTAYEVYHTFISPEQRRLAAARLGRTSSEQPVTSWEALKHRMEQQEALIQRKAVLMQKEPNMMNELIRALAGQRMDTSPLTDSEMSLGNVPRAPEQRYRAREAPMTLLDNLLSEMGNR